ncbi:MAG TPA: hypothetical protein VEU51_12295 [Candidatus Acidoferrales bacterium]|nr:hypothetical protein [Candidatus Acidoferrales bacterium]
MQRAYILSDELVEIDFLATADAATLGECLYVLVGTPLAAIEHQAVHSTLDLCEGDKRRAPRCSASA